MPLTIWTPDLNERPRFKCNVCGAMLFSERSYESHVPRCVKAHEDVVARYAELRRPDFFFGSIDPEYRAYHKAKLN